MTEEELIISNTVLEMNNDLLKSVIMNMEKFISESVIDENDKNNFSDFAIITAAFVMTIKELDKHMHPNISKTIIEMLQNEQKKKLN